MRELSLTDELTGLANRRGFLVRAGEVLTTARRHGWPAVLAFVDVDRLKEINDRFGHRRGDAVIREVAAVLASSARESDIVARWGGDEFVVLLPDTDDEHTVRSRLVAGAQRDVGVELGVSIGTLVVVPEDDRSLDELLDEADRRMYADKRRHAPLT